MGRYSEDVSLPSCLRVDLLSLYPPPPPPQWKLFLWTTSLEYELLEARAILMHDCACTHIHTHGWGGGRLLFIVCEGWREEKFSR